MKETDTYYIKSCCNGHPDDYRFLVQRYQGALIGHLMGRLADRERAEEAAQESLVRAFFKIETLKKPECFFAWLLGIADRVVLEQQRKQQNQLRRQKILRSMQASPAQAFSEDGGLEKAMINLMMPIQVAVGFYAQLVRQHQDPAYYGDRVTPAMPKQVLMRWQIADDQYRVIFGDLSKGTATRQELADLEAVLPPAKTP